MNLKELDKKVRISKAETNILEMEFKIAERLEDIERLKSHIEKQKELIKTLKEG
jgi:hypothetical protein